MEIFNQTIIGKRIVEYYRRFLEYNIVSLSLKYTNQNTKYI